MRHRDVVSAILEKIDGAKTVDTCDTFKCGSPDDETSGIACTFTASVEVIERARALDANLLITHEPTFYSHLDNNPVVESSEVVARKKALLVESGISVYRCHDNWHTIRPDGILTGMVRALGWGGFLIDYEGSIFHIPSTTLGGLAMYVKARLSGKSVRYVGDPDMTCNVIGMKPGASGANSHFAMLMRDDVDVLFCGEGHEWEAVEYIRDATQLGLRKGIILAGHANSEEAGMEYFAEWLKEFVSGIPVHFLPAGDPLRCV